MARADEFEDLECIGRGGFGEVVRCQRRSDGKVFARKRILSFPSQSGGDEVRRFVREVRLLTRLKHPNILPIIAANTSSEPFWYVTPLYEHSLLSHLPEIVCRHEQIHAVVGKVIAAVNFAHKNGILHRDISLGNVLLNSLDDVVVGDFGLARSLADVDSTRTVSLQFFGTRYFMPPEALELGSKYVDERGDIYSIGRLIVALYLGVLKYGFQGVIGLPDAVRQCVNSLATDYDQRLESMQEVEESWQRVPVTLDVWESFSLDLLRTAVSYADGGYREAAIRDAIRHFESQRLFQMTMSEPRAAIPQALAAHYASFARAIFGFVGVAPLDMLLYFERARPKLFVQLVTHAARFLERAIDDLPGLFRRDMIARAHELFAQIPKLEVRLELMIIALTILVAQQGKRATAENVVNSMFCQPFDSSEISLLCKGLRTWWKKRGSGKAELPPIRTEEFAEPFQRFFASCQ
ncbi:MAG TPA: protein kinase [Pirellulaceae bacterium]|jgi:protein kinase-like protein|nr:protein kinase [Pirellulaceae bacterium]